MKIYEVINNMKITNCCENLIRFLLTLEYMCHKILINAHLKLFMKKLLPSIALVDMTLVRGEEEASDVGLNTSSASTTTPSHTHSHGKAIKVLGH